MKFVHHARDKFYGEGEVNVEAERLLALRQGRASENEMSVGELLTAYRTLEKRGTLLKASP